MFEKKLRNVRHHKKSYDLNIQTISEKVDSAVSGPKKTSRRCFLGLRHAVTLVGFLSCFLQTADRLVLGVGIVAMVKHRQTAESSNWNGSEISCPMSSDAQKIVFGSNFQGEFDWSTELQGYLLGVGSLSYLFTQIPAGRLADAVGSKSLLVYSNAASGIFTLISPFTARWHVYALMTVQFLRGASQGFTTPAMYKLISNWIPRNERGTLSTLVVCGYAAGVAIAGLVTGWLCDIPGLGWPFAFYVWGFISVMLSIVFQFIYYEHPENHPWITDEELNFITDGLETGISKK
ncbi:Putative inorganic phosphate cotransporter, partial [Araneus ventricosus]